MKLSHFNISMKRPLDDFLLLLKVLPCNVYMMMKSWYSGFSAWSGWFSCTEYVLGWTMFGVKSCAFLRSWFQASCKAYLNNSRWIYAAYSENYWIFYDLNFWNVYISCIVWNFQIMWCLKVFLQVDLYLLPQSAFPTGGLYFKNQTWVQETKGMHVIIHNNYITGFEKKIKRFHDFGLWLVDDHALESPLGRLW